jgi:hypothetical protein
MHSSSLRAKRGNPDSGAAGLPRFARNDDSHLLLCALGEVHPIALGKRVVSPAEHDDDISVAIIHFPHTSTPTEDFPTPKRSPLLF